ncbi:MAG: trypsin-like peptidase domain-containing protein [Patescibacteria group bacterium]
MEKHHRVLLCVVIIVSLIVGAFAGAMGSMFLVPYLEKFTAGQEFLANPFSLEKNENKILGCEDSATVDVVKKTSGSVVSIVVSKDLKNIYNSTGPDAMAELKNFLPDENGQEVIGGGTGFVVDASGLILTNKHVVVDEKADYSVVFNDGKKFDAKVLGRDPINDMAVLKIEAQNLIPLTLGDSDKIEIGETVIAIGNALSEYNNSVTRGVVSGINRHIYAGDNRSGGEAIEAAIQTDAAINPGNSGGPLLNLRGEVIGINTAVNWQGQSLGFAIPINGAKTVVSTVKEFGEIIRPWLGVRYVAVDEALQKSNNLKYNYGALILRGMTEADVAVVKDSPADKAGLLENDIILEVNGIKLSENNSLVSEVSKYKPDDEVTLKILRKDEEKEVKVKLEKRK